MTATPDWMPVDELAIEIACDGVPMKLNLFEQREAIARMRGKYIIDDIARLIGCTTRQVERIIQGVV